MNKKAKVIMLESNPLMMYSAKRELVEHFNRLESERGFSHPMRYDLTSQNIEILKDLGYKESIIGREFRETDRVLLGFFTGLKQGGFLIHNDDVDKLLNLIIQENMSFIVQKFSKDNIKFSSMLKDPLYIKPYNYEHVYNKRLLVLISYKTIDDLAKKNRLIANPSVLFMLDELRLQKSKNMSHYMHSLSIERVMLFILKNTTTSFVASHGFTYAK